MKVTVMAHAEGRDVEIVFDNVVLVQPGADGSLILVRNTLMPGDDNDDAVFEAGQWTSFEGKVKG